MKIVAFGHRQRVGKNTACKIINHDLRLKYPGINIKNRGFADKLKEVCYDLYSWTGIHEPAYYEEFLDQKETIIPSIHMTMRQVWIGVGNRMREVYEPIWIENLLQTKNCDLLLIYDLRFPIEIHRIKELGGLCIKINNPRIPEINDEADRALKDLDDSNWDFIINNNEGLREFSKNLIDLESHIMANVTIKNKPTRY